MHNWIVICEIPMKKKCVNMQSKYEQKVTHMYQYPRTKMTTLIYWVVEGIGPGGGPLYFKEEFLFSYSPEPWHSNVCKFSTKKIHGQLPEKLLRYVMLGKGLNFHFVWVYNKIIQYRVVCIGNTQITQFLLRLTFAIRGRTLSPKVLESTTIYWATMLNLKLHF